jgi:hypothetical protein
MEIRARRSKTKTGADAIQAKAAMIDGFKGDFSEGYSDADYLNIMSRSWHFGSKSGTTTQGNGVAEAVKELVLIAGFGVYQDHMTYELVEKQTMILAQMLAIMTEQARPDRVAIR